MGRDHAIECERHPGTWYSGFDGPDRCPKCEKVRHGQRWQMGPPSPAVWEIVAVDEHANQAMIRVHHGDDAGTITDPGPTSLDLVRTGRLLDAEETGAR